MYILTWDMVIMWLTANATAVCLSYSWVRKIIRYIVVYVLSAVHLNSSARGSFCMYMYHNILITCLCPVRACMLPTRDHMNISDKR